jgi:plastocyanin
VNFRSSIYHLSLALRWITVVCLAPATWAGTVEGKVVAGRPPGLRLVSHPAVVWLEGTVSPPADSPLAVMAQKGGRFVPDFLIVVVGETVEMPNLDNVAHNIYSTSPAKTFNLGFYAKGEYKSVKFDRPGVVEAGCSIHNFMHAEILVVPNALYSTVGEDGTFRIRHIPAGQYAIAFWADGTPQVGGLVRVSDQGATRFDINVHSPLGQK